MQLVLMHQHQVAQPQSAPRLWTPFLPTSSLHGFKVSSATVLRTPGYAQRGALHVAASSSAQTVAPSVSQDTPSPSTFFFPFFLAFEGLPISWSSSHSPHPRHPC
ncbi:hypothetical protein O6H91_06G100200 [Diphasiastrum complanatum]|uniref:Uncharacterized protein n=1 Tax=Diphasiastrum complanatum TaxID=34168 RepID=A0ACC2DHB0_DIPCM|nr:hypothetical protein O6H91_06G100200 [Diphasiastrum complanatum]